MSETAYAQLIKRFWILILFYLEETADDLIMHILLSLLIFLKGLALLMTGDFVRGYVALLQKKDPKLCSLQIFSKQQQCDEHHNNSSPVSVANHHRWNCSKCLDRVKNSATRTTSETVSMQQDGTNDGCSISVVRTLPNNFDSRRLFSWTRQSSQGNDSILSKSAQGCNSKCRSPGNKAVTAVNVPAILDEENVSDTFVERSVPVTKGMAELGKFLIITFLCIQ